ncbi:DUF3924 family protein [Ectobacillus ponti]|uniref:DUF3924 family protein n=1 Tax=Ectobacillus ponti TaxID=2961894 RepID=A0AA42BSQ7_9BACI|nr:DUF3924 family protein [Ectobacillus ponti]MCP8968698.1 DUF3924 family protein [Ectobacillus ponti]
METYILEVGLSKEARERLDMLLEKQRRQHSGTTESDVVESLIMRAFVQEITPFDAKQFRSVHHRSI